MGCAEPEDENLFTWDVKVTGVDNSCTEDAGGSAETFTFGAAFEGSLVALKIVGTETTDTFATGSISGCTVSYESQVVGEPDRAGGPVQWVLSGEAVYRTGGEVCNMAENVAETAADMNIDLDSFDYLNGADPDQVDWVGQETFEVVASENESVAVGCTYTSFVAGTYNP
jgi:hypothetical protein